MTEPRWTTKLRQPVREWQWVTIYRDDVDVAVVLVGPEYAAELCARIEGERGSETCQTCGDDPKLAEIIKAFGFRPDIAALHIQRLKAERDALKDELTELEETDRRILADATPKDEDHCYCVVPLRKEVDRLREALGDYGEHQRACVLRHWEMFDPPLRRAKYAGEWYSDDSPPRCTCGLNAALATPEEKALCLDCGAQGELPHLKGCDEYDPTAESGEGEEG